MNLVAVTALDDVVHAMRSHARVTAHGALTKRPLVIARDGTTRLDTSGLAGITEYNPAEFTFTALAGTPLHIVESLLAAHGQHMPFDPPLVDAGATVAGTIAAGINGSCRLRGGGLRDFIIGIRFVDGTGAVVRGGGRVVKNAAGFDLPRLMVGSMGQLGVIVEATFKVFPLPEARATLRVECQSIDDAIHRMSDLARAPFDIEALDLEPPNILMLRLGGDAASLARHAQRVGLSTSRAFDILRADEDRAYWRAQREFVWLKPGHWLIRVPLQLQRLAALDQLLAREAVMRRYALAGNVAWLAWPARRALASLDLGTCIGQIVRGPARDAGSPVIGTAAPTAGAFAERVSRALDPSGRLRTFEMVDS
jgi:glycolate oxidase FAD binding subunit